MLGERAAHVAQQHVALALGVEHPPQRGDEGFVVLGAAVLAEGARDLERAHVVLRRAEHRVGKQLHGLVHLAAPALVVVGGDQREQEGGLLERVGDVVGRLHQLGEGPPARAGLGAHTRVHHQLVGAALPILGALGEFARRLAVALVAVGEAVAQALGERMAVGRVLGEQVELVVPAQVAREQQAGVVGHQRERLALLHRRARQPHALEHEGACLLGA